MTFRIHTGKAADWPVYRNAVAAAARELGAHRLALRVTAGNQAASRCYTRYGFVPTGRSWPMERRPELTEVELALSLD